MSWSAIVVLAVGAYACKALGTEGLSRLGRIEGGGPPWLARGFPVVAGLVPAALFAALVAVQTLEADGALAVDARLVGVGGAGIAVWRRAPFVVVVVSAMAVTALIRWQTS